MLVSAMLTYPASTAVQAITFGDYVVKGIMQLWDLDPATVVFLTYGIGITLLGKFMYSLE